MNFETVRTWMLASMATVYKIANKPFPDVTKHQADIDELAHQLVNDPNLAGLTLTPKSKVSERYLEMFPTIPEHGNFEERLDPNTLTDADKQAIRDKMSKGTIDRDDGVRFAVSWGHRNGMANAYFSASIPMLSALKFPPIKPVEDFLTSALYELTSSIGLSNSKELMHQFSSNGVLHIVFAVSPQGAVSVN